VAVDVRRAGPDDWPSARAVRLAALADAPAAFGSTHGREVRFEEAEWRNRIANSAWFLAWLDGDPVGLVVGIADEAAPAERHVVSMWVRTDVRGTDAAPALVCAVREWARTQGADCLTLWVADGNDRARRFYQGIGFRTTCQRQPLPSNPAVGEKKLRLQL
jgi:GNAT superfamily N-acetyltransferase